MIYLSFFLTVTLSIYGIFNLRTEKKGSIQERLNFFLLNTEQENKPGLLVETHLSFYKRFILPLFVEFKKSFKKRMPGEKEAKIDKKVQMAGSPFGMTAVDFRIVQVISIIVLPLIFFGYGALLEAGKGIVVIFVLFGILIGFFTPHFYLKQKMKTRNHLALREFPDILDLLTVSLEAGLGFDAAISKVVAKKEGPLAMELHRCLEEIRLGKTRREALSGIKERLDVDEIKSFIGSVLQAEKLGIGMVQMLRVISNEVREQRKQRAEEEAMKAPIKMLFPLVLFIFPSLFIVLLGPAVIQVIETFKNG
ncbi:tight adherence protein C [Bacillus sp. SORGH_AS 510]|uniref:type II secretion system F family protein n=1 Tax=Bacillus sp. SORGH_AS_0510 TaxID=3041771 RepID=UPI002784E959|nr:type II secretion system F family protein [Bacillus sp. SORGH_AS_0510]MDQ1147138.1 tight adherence protein C [Bacillus sp. SORGH_AS_0510]